MPSSAHTSSSLAAARRRASKQVLPDCLAFSPTTSYQRGRGLRPLKRLPQPAGKLLSRPACAFTAVRITGRIQVAVRDYLPVAENLPGVATDGAGLREMRCSSV